MSKQWKLLKNGKYNDKEKQLHNYISNYVDQKKRNVSTEALHKERNT